MEPSPRPSRSSSSASRRSNLSLDLSNLPPPVLPTAPTNTLLFTNLNDVAVFLPENLQTIRDLITQTAPIHAFAPLKSFRRIVISFFDEQAAIAVRQIWDAEHILGQQLKVYFGQHTSVTARDEHLALPDAGKLFFISPPPSPPHDWEMRLEDAPNKLVHAEDLAEALAKLHHRPGPFDSTSPVTPPDSALPGRTRSRSSTLIYKPNEQSTMPAVFVEDMTDEPEVEELSPVDSSKPIMAHTSRPPVELMSDA
ncbi:Calcipressin-domain-containing protein [Ilyonectria robusta]|uniref:Calcipressin-domain-containing protein n=1 Tax=Ilyonectria robusta TaxID=1079257 RepID=UPI001E8E90F6|nr:Calcipressin-domain-containing protein [Ilyonectria robusta]KAH6977145.1 Calcipressin-domain-containing protein [Ilyonectria sp. MPI-CAGE-AT-0026]KAH8714355.1 Calcipressin-domain-containing protein [Ilyonectria robusta]